MVTALKFSEQISFIRKFQTITDNQAPEFMFY